MASTQSRAKQFVATVNNPTGAIATPELFKDALHARFPVHSLAGQHEVGESGTPHLQLAFRLVDRIRLRQLIAAVPGAHFAVMRGSPQQAFAYATKSDTRAPDTVPFTFGEQPTRGTGQGRRTDLLEVKEAIDNGATLLDVFEQHFPAACQHHRSFTLYKNLKIPPRVRLDLKVYWFYGPTGTGKSRKVHTLVPHEDTYFKQPESTWFDAYDGQKVLVLDDFRKNWVTFGYFLKWLDVNPLLVQRKGTSVWSNWSTVFITAPYPPDQLYATHEDVAQLVRRVTKVFSYPEDAAYLAPLDFDVFKSGNFPERIAEIFSSDQLYHQ